MNQLYTRKDIRSAIAWAIVVAASFSLFLTSFLPWSTLHLLRYPMGVGRLRRRPPITLRCRAYGGGTGSTHYSPCALFMFACLLPSIYSSIHHLIDAHRHDHPCPWFRRQRCCVPTSHSHGLEQQCNASIRSLGSSIKARLKESPSPGKQASKRRGGFAIHQGNGEDTDDFFIMSIGFFFPSLSQAKASEGESRNS